jgi:HPt (histidine-containing phosphotransfer) domain-containing protein
VTGPSKPAPNTEVIDRARWERVLDDVGAQALLRYGDLYRELLADRLDAIERAIAADATREALQVLADLRISSAMIGAVRLEAVAAAAEAELRRDPQARGIVDLRALRSEADAVDGTLGAILHELAAKHG